MKQQDLLLTPGWATALPNWQYVDVENQPTILTEFHRADGWAGKPLGRREDGLLLRQRQD